jgi:hypothetical protein
MKSVQRFLLSRRKSLPPRSAQQVPTPVSSWASGLRAHSTIRPTLHSSNAVSLHSRQHVGISQVRQVRTSDPILRSTDRPTAGEVPGFGSLQDRIVEIRSPEQAHAVISRMRQYASPQYVWACDTEVTDIDLDEQGPVGNGKVICASIYGGPDVDVGYGKGKIIWVDNAGDAHGTLDAFKEWFEDESVHKAWHNYGFDRHVMFNEGIDCKGFRGDTMHMARLWDTGRDKAQGGKGYSLESLSSLLIPQTAEKPNVISVPPNNVKNPAICDTRAAADEDGTAARNGDDTDAAKKISMLDLFGVAKKKKDGEDSKILVLPPLMDLQMDPSTRPRWIEYSSRDALSTWQLFRHLEQQLKKRPWLVEDQPTGESLLSYYERYMRPFGEVLTDMERRGIFIDTEHHLKEAEARARAERRRMENIFLSWVSTHCTDAKYLNTASTAQMMQFFFGTYENKRLTEDTKVFKIEKSPEEYESEAKENLLRNKYLNSTVGDMKATLKQRGLPVSGKKNDIMQRLLVSDLLAAQLVNNFKKDGDVDAEALNAALSKELSNPNSSAVAHANRVAEEIIANNSTKTSRFRDISIKTLGLTPVGYTPKGTPQVTSSVLRTLAGKNLFGDGMKRLSFRSNTF